MTDAAQRAKRDSIQIGSHEYRFTTFATDVWHVKIWRAGDVRAFMYSAASEELALTKAFEATEKFEAEQRRLHDCGLCHGAGQYVSASGVVHCLHPGNQTSPSFPNGAPSRTEAEVREQISWSRSLDRKARLDRLERAAGNTNPVFEITT